VSDAQNEWLMYVGTYTRREPHVIGRSRGIEVFRYSAADASMTHVTTVAGIANPSYLAIHPNGEYLYAVSEVADPVDGRPTGAVHAFRIERPSGNLQALNHQITGGAGPCYLAVDATGRAVVVSNYDGGSVALLPLLGDGTLGPASDFIQHEGSSVNPQRQKEPHPHSVNIDPTNRLVLVPDLGQDKIVIYELDLEHGRLAAHNAQPWARTKSGAGPRHVAFHPNGELMFVVNELDSTVTSFGLNSEKGTLHMIDSWPTLPEGFDGKSSCADIHVHPNGQYLYASNRGHDSIAVFAIDAGRGLLKPQGHTPTGGKTPRNFALDPTGQYLLAANQNSDDIHVLQVDARHGKLTPTGQKVEAPTPVCIKFVAL
jgi:6-phosphogluconolactonase